MQGLTIWTLIAWSHPRECYMDLGPIYFQWTLVLNRIVCGGEEGVVRIWNFSQALEIKRGSMF
uniref:F-box/WD-40 repeat-containing protein At5g21040 n=1 Tax=Rhizophora mucronata TaxID=61149 RepID=A0A2P2IQ87_RHIMU